MINAKMYQFKRRWKIVTINKPTSKIKFALFVEKRQEKILSQIVDKSLYLSRKDIGFLLYIGNFRNEIVFFCIF